MNQEEQKEYEEKIGSPEMEYLQYLSEHPELIVIESDGGSPRNTGAEPAPLQKSWTDKFSKNCEREEKKEWEDKLITTLPDCDVKVIDDYYSSLLAKQQEENQKIIDGIFEIKERELARQREEFVKIVDVAIAGYIGRNELEPTTEDEAVIHALLDIKSKLNI
jgi:hypothetical protein